MKGYNKDKESSYLMYGDTENLYGWGISQKLPDDDFKTEENASNFDEKFLKNCDDNSDKGYI